MSLLPFFDDSYLFRPSRLLDQRFGDSLDLEDFLQPFSAPRMTIRCPAGYLRPWTSVASGRDVGSTVNIDKEKFQANLDVQQFKPEEISVKVTGDMVTIEGKHEEKEDEHGFISRQFLRRYTIPKDCDINRVESKLSSDGVLTITAPKTESGQLDHRSIPITQTGEPVRKIENKKVSDKGDNNLKVNKK